MLTEEDRRATEALINVKPAWTGMRTAAGCTRVEDPLVTALRSNLRRRLMRSRSRY